MRPSRWHSSTVVSLATGVAAFATYVATASRTITWWEGSTYPLAACTLGITGPPGSLLLTLMGWVVTRIPVIHPVAFRLNLLAALIAAGTVALVTALSIGLATREDRRPAGPELAAGAVAGLAFAFALSVWSYAVRFTPYMLSAGFAALILAAVLAWWRRAESGEAAGRLLLIFLLLGLDFSVHRMNTLLLPAALVAITLRRPGGWARPERWGAIATGLVLGLGVQLLLIPLSLRQPLLDIGEPNSLARLWSYVSLRQFGGGFLFRVLPRKADFFGVQLSDYWTFLRQNLAPAAPWAPLSVLPGVLVLVGWVASFRRVPLRTLALLVFYFCASLGAVVYFNLPAHYFRAMDRHYLPSLVLLTPLMAVGAVTLLRLALRAPQVLRHALVAGFGVLLLLIPLAAWNANHRTCNLAPARFTEAYARDVLATLPANAILLTNGDNDTLPLWYMQWVEHVRPDVAVINLPMTNMSSYVAQLRRRDPRLAGLKPGPDPPGPVRLTDTKVAITRAGAAPDAPPESLDFESSGERWGQDFVVLQLLGLVARERPVCVACSVPEENIAWIWPHVRLDGMSFRLVPPSAPAGPDVEHLRHELIEVVRYTDIADTTVVMDRDSMLLGRNYVAVLLILANAQLDAGDAGACLATLQFAEAHVPLARLEMDAGTYGEVRTRAEARMRGLDAAPQTAAPR